MAPAGLFLLLYSCARIAVEFWRLPDTHLGYLAGGWVTMGMLLSLPMLLIGATLLVHGLSAARTFGQLLRGGATGMKPDR